MASLLESWLLVLKRGYRIKYLLILLVFWLIMSRMSELLQSLQQFDSLNDMGSVGRNATGFLTFISLNPIVTNPQRGKVTVANSADLESVVLVPS